MADWVLRICFAGCPCCASYFSLREFPQRGVCGRVKCKRGGSALTSCLKAFCLDSFLPFRAPITVCQKGEKNLHGWLVLVMCVRSTLFRQEHGFRHNAPQGLCLPEERGWVEWLAFYQQIFWGRKLAIVNIINANDGQKDSSLSSQISSVATSLIASECFL